MSTPRRVPPRVLLGLGAAVLLAHLALLQGMPVRLGQGGTPETHLSFVTRSVAPPVTPTAPARQPPPPARTTPPVPPAAAPARPEAPTPTSEPAPAAADLNPPAASDPPEASHEAAPQAQQTPPAQTPPPRERDPLPVSAYKLPGSVHLKYQLEAKRFPITLSADLHWRQDGSTYDARLDISAFGLSRTQTSQGRVGADGLAPLRFSDKLRTEVAAHFDREKGRVTFSANTPDATLQAGAQDRLSVLLQLATLFAGDPGRYPAGTTIAIQTIGPRDADTWLFTVGEPERLALPGGELETLKVVRNPRKEFDQRVELWLAPTLDYLPARIRITEASGDYVDQKLLSRAPLD